VCCQVEVFASSRSPDQRSPTECGLFVCDGDLSIMKGVLVVGTGETKLVRSCFSGNTVRLKT
jgi:hypothetical protein